MIDVTDFISKDNNITGFDANAKKGMGLGAVAADRSYNLVCYSFCTKYRDQNFEDL